MHWKKEEPMGDKGEQVVINQNWNSDLVKMIQEPRIHMTRCFSELSQSVRQMAEYMWNAREWILDEASNQLLINCMHEDIKDYNVAIFYFKHLQNSFKMKSDPAGTPSALKK